MNRLQYTILIGLLCLAARQPIFGAEGFNDAAFLPTPCTPTIYKAADTLPPAINCPASVTFDLPLGKCDTIFKYLVVAYDDKPGYTLAQTLGLPSESNFPPGNTVNTFKVIDSDGLTASCSFTVSVKVRSVGTLSCRSNLSVGLDQQCSYTLRAIQALLNNNVCDGAMSVQIKSIGTPWMAPVFGKQSLGKTFDYRVTETATGNFCFGSVKVQDLSGPTIACKTLQISCAVPDTKPGYLADSLKISDAIPPMSDNCAAKVKQFFYSDRATTPGCDSVGDTVYEIFRTWNASDSSGNTSSCEQRIRLFSVFDKIRFPADIAIDCEKPNTAPTATGRPHVMVNNRTIPLVGSICNTGISYTDTLQRVCGDAYRIRRRWRATNSCAKPGAAKTDSVYVQTIEVRDQSPPILNCPQQVTLSAPAVSCLARVNLPDVTIADHCSPPTAVTAYWAASNGLHSLSGRLVGFPGNVPGLRDTLGVLDTASNFPIGRTVVRYVANDFCGNQNTCEITVEVWDQAPPKAACKTTRRVWLGLDGRGYVAASSLDNSSSDNCTTLSFRARRLAAQVCQDTLFYRDSLMFCCRDVGDTVEVSLRAYDVLLPSAQLALNFAKGQWGECKTRVLVLDSLPLRCTPPPNISVSCAAFDPNLAYGQAKATCVSKMLTETVDRQQFDVLCGTGVIVRQFKAEDDAGNSHTCSQAITITGQTDDYVVKFPDDIIVTNCKTQTNWGSPQLSKVDCENLSIQFKDDTITVASDACYRIERRWTIARRCRYDPSKPFTQVPNPAPMSVTTHVDNLPGPIVAPPGNAAPWAPTLVKIAASDALPTDYSKYWTPVSNGYQYTQIIRVNDTEVPVLGRCQDRVFLDSTSNTVVLWNDNYSDVASAPKKDLREAGVDLSITTIDNCGNRLLSVSYLLFLDLDGNGTPETVINSGNPQPAGTLLFGNANSFNYLMGTARTFDQRNVPLDDKYRFDLMHQMKGDSLKAQVVWSSINASGQFAMPQLPHGKHRIRWKIRDVCGNETVCEREFNIRDGLPPRLQCDATADAEILPTQYAKIDLSQLSVLVSDNNTPSQDIGLSLRKGSGTTFPVDTAGMLIRELLFSCADTGQVPIEVWARDRDGGTSKCTVRVYVSDVNRWCGRGGVRVWGNLRTLQGKGIPYSAVFLKTSHPVLAPAQGYIPADAAGNYSIEDFMMLGSNYEITPSNDSFPTDGVTTLDLALISKHILGITPLDSPYKMVAADANRSGTITTFDVVELRKLILGIYDRLPKNTVWRFMPIKYSFPDPKNPFAVAFPEKISVVNMLKDTARYDFVGIKTGDVNNSLGVKGIETRTGDLLLEVANHSLRRGDEIEAVIATSEPLIGLQFTLNCPNLEILDIQPGQEVALDHFQVFPTAEALTMAWYHTAPTLPAFKVRFRAKQTGLLSDFLSISSRITRAEAYLDDSNPEVLRPVLHYDNNTLPQHFVLHQNSPNPFRQETEIGFYLPEDSNVRLTIVDASGRLIHQQTAFFQRGERIFETGDVLNALPRGVYWYRVDTDKAGAVRKMVKK